MSYQRVLPRDLFNEAKLLNCLGRLFLLDVEGSLPDSVRLEHDTETCQGFDVEQNSSDGSLFVRNIDIYVNELKYTHFCPLNSRDKYPLILLGFEDDEYYVFDEKGDVMPDFLIRKEG